MTPGPDRFRPPSNDRRGPWPRGPLRTPLARAAVALAAVAGGCDVRDEPVVGPSTVWPLAAGRLDGGSAGRDGSPAELAYEEGYEAAARRAAAEGRPLLLVFGAAWCRWSGELARGPLADGAVVDRARRCVCALVDADRDAATCRSFDVTAFPTVVVLDATGRERFRGTGAGGATGLAAAIDAACRPPAQRDRLAGEDRGADPAADVTR